MNFGKGCWIRPGERRDFGKTEAKMELKVRSRLMGLTRDVLMMFIVTMMIIMINICDD
jgi:hypothetical protein